MIRTRVPNDHDQNEILMKNENIDALGHSPMDPYSLESLTELNLVGVDHLKFQGVTETGV